MMRTARTFLPLTLLLLGSWPAWAKTDAEIQQAVQEVIMDRHPHDTPEWWRGLGSHAPAVIEQMYAADSSTYHHMRMLEGLAAFVDDPAALAFVQRQAETAQDDVIRTAAIRAVGVNQGARQEDWISKFLHHEDPHTRLLAAEMLRKMGTSSAASKVSSFMGEERTPWVVAALKGEKPQASAPLAPSGSSEERLTPDLSGTWRGYWVTPRSDASDGMRSLPAELKLAVQGVTGISGTLRVKDKSKIRVLTLAGATGKGSRFRGNLVEEIPKAKKEEQPVEAELKRQGANLILEIHSSMTAGAMILRRDAAQ